jgi:hypothetical protein
MEKISHPLQLNPNFFGPLKFSLKNFRSPPSQQRKISVNSGKSRKIFTPPQSFTKIFAPLEFFAKTSNFSLKLQKSHRFTKIHSWGFGGRCKPPNGVQGQSPGKFFNSAYFYTVFFIRIT